MESKFLTCAKNDPRLKAVPPHMLESIQRYLERGIPCGSFLSAVLANDLRKAADRADDINRRLLWEYVYALHNYAPCVAWGSLEKVAEWGAARQADCEAA